MRGVPSATSVGCGSSATLTAPLEISLMRSVFLPHAALVDAVVGSEMLHTGVRTCILCQCSEPTSAFNHCLFFFCHPLLFYVILSRLAFPASLTVLLCCIGVSVMYFSVCNAQCAL